MWFLWYISAVAMIASGKYEKKSFFSFSMSTVFWISDNNKRLTATKNKSFTNVLLDVSFVSVFGFFFFFGFQTYFMGIFIWQDNWCYAAAKIKPEFSGPEHVEVYTQLLFLIPRLSSSYTALRDRSVSRWRDTTFILWRVDVFATTCPSGK